MISAATTSAPSHGFRTCSLCVPRTHTHTLTRSLFLSLSFLPPALSHTLTLSLSLSLSFLLSPLALSLCKYVCVYNIYIYIYVCTSLCVCRVDAADAREYSM